MLEIGKKSIFTAGAHGLLLSAFLGGAMIRNKERGQSMTEYVLIIALIVGVIFAAFQIFGPQLQGALTAIGMKIAGAAAK